MFPRRGHQESHSSSTYLNSLEASAQPVVWEGLEGRQPTPASSEQNTARRLIKNHEINGKGFLDWKGFVSGSELACEIKYIFRKKKKGKYTYFVYFYDMLISTSSDFN